MTDGKSLDEFKSEYAVQEQHEKAVEEALQRLGDAWLSAGEFARSAGLSTPQLKAVRGKFKDHLVQANNWKILWAGTAEFAAQMREILNGRR